MDYYTVLVPEVRDDPLGRGYSGMTDAEAAADLNTPSQTVVVSRRCDERVIIAEFEPSATAADAFLDKLQLVAEDAGFAAHGLVAKVLKWLNVPVESGGGFDFGHPRTQAIAPALVGQQGITEAEVAALLALANETQSRAQQLGLGTVSSGHVKSAREQIGA